MSTRSLNSLDGLQLVASRQVRRALVLEKVGAAIIGTFKKVTVKGTKVRENPRVGSYYG